MSFTQKKWGPALLPAPTAPSEGSAGVRSTWSPLPERLGVPLLDPGSPAQASLPSHRSLVRGALTSTRLRFPRVRLSFDLSSLPVRTRIPGPKSSNSNPPVKADRCSAALLGVTTLASRFAHQSSEELQ